MAAVAVRYARALADVVTDPKTAAAGASDALRVELRSFLETLNSSEELRNVLSNPAVPAPKKRAIVEKLGEVLKLSRIGQNFLFVLIDNRRMGILKEVLDTFEAMLDEQQGIVRAEVTTAAELPAAERELLESALATLTGKRVRARYDVDSALIGGVRTRIGSTIYDGSVQEQLRQIRQELTH
jgi:F-type H+-transporting ATPase subunit delta